MENIKIKFEKKLNPEFFNSFEKFQIDDYLFYCHERYRSAIVDNLNQITDHNYENNQTHRNLVNVIYQQKISYNNNEIEIVVKKSKHRSIIQKSLSIVKSSKAIRAFYAAKFLLEHHLDTPFPIAVIEKRKSGFLLEAYYITEAISPHDRVKKLFKKSREEKNYPWISSLMNAVTDYTRVMHQAGFIHLDLNLSNFLISPIDDESYRLTLIDLNRGKYYHELSTFQKVRDISRLYWKELRGEFFFIYCQRDKDLIALKWYYDLYYCWRSKRRKLKKKLK